MCPQSSTRGIMLRTSERPSLILQPVSVPLCPQWSPRRIILRTSARPSLILQQTFAIIAVPGAISLYRNLSVSVPLCPQWSPRSMILHTSARPSLILQPVSVPLCPQWSLSPRTSPHTSSPIPHYSNALLHMPMLLHSVYQIQPDPTMQLLPWH